MTNDQLIALAIPARKMIAEAASEAPPGATVDFCGLCVRRTDMEDDCSYNDDGDPDPNAPDWIFEAIGCVSGFRGVAKVAIRNALACPGTMTYAEVVAALVADYAKLGAASQ